MQIEIIIIISNTTVSWLILIFQATYMTSWLGEIKANFSQQQSYSYGDQCFKYISFLFSEVGAGSHHQSST
jgi:hypothetical protein